MKKLYSVLLFLISVTLFAQTYTFTTFNTNNSGIAANNVNDFKMSSSGTFWIATNNGLSKMVGNSFTNYNTSNSNIGTNMLNKVAVAGTTVWISTYGNGIIRYNGTTFTNFNTNQQGMPNNTATGIATDAQGTLWMASSSGLSKYNGSSWTTYNTSNSQLWSNNVTSVAVDASSNVLVSAGGMLQRFNGTTFTTVTDGVMSILKVTTAGIYVNTGDGLGKIVNNQFTDLYWPNSSCLASCSINAVGLDETNKVWLGLDNCGNYAGGVQNFTNCITYTTSNSVLPHNSITSLHVVDSNVIWAGTLEGGLVRMNRADDATCNPPTGLNVPQFGQNTAYLNWTAANPAPGQGYRYRYNTINNVTGGIESYTNETSAGIDQLQPNTTYYWWVASVCEPLTWVSGGSFTTQPAPVNICNPPTQPYVAQFGQTTASLAWTAASPAPGQGYRYRYNTVNNVTGGIESYTYETSAGIDQLQPNTTYYWWVASVCEPLTWVPGGSFTTQSASATCGVPTGLSVTNITSNSSRLNWSAPASIPTSYDLYIVTTNTPPSANTPATVTSTTAGIGVLSGLAPATTYYYWIRSNCSSVRSAWVSGGSFTTIALAGCNGASNGLYPDATFTPACTGSNEQIVADAYAGEYSNVNVLANKQYTFTSSVATDFITITNAAGTTVLASGQTPLSWSSANTSGVIRYYLHANANCSSQESSRIRSVKCTAAPVSTCGVPTTPLVSSITSNSVRLVWNPVATASTYEVYVATSSTPPTDNTAPTTTTGVNNVRALNNLLPATTYYYWVRSVCGSSKSAWVSGGNFTTIAALSCNGAFNGLWPDNNFTPACTGANEQITANAWGGEYSNVNVVANRQYTFTSSVSTDYLTITNATGTIVLASGSTPLVWNSGNTTGVIRYHLHTNANCGNQSTDRVRYIKCVDAPAAACGVPTGLAVSNITSNSVRLNWNAPATAPTNYEIYVSAANTAPGDNTPVTMTTGATNTRISANILPSATYYYWVRSNCGSSKSAWVFGGNFTTIAALSCNGASYGLYPTATFTPACTGANEQIATDAWAGEYTNVNVIASKEYTFTSSIATDYLTITNATGTTVLASGLTPLVWNSGNNAGAVRYYLHANANCGEQNTARVRSVKCADLPGTPCALPLNLVVTNITSNSVYMDWDAGTSSSVSYEIYYSTANIAPDANTTPTITTNPTLKLVPGLAASTTYYYWIRTSCSNSKSAWVSGGSFTTIPALSCNGATTGLFPAATFTPACTGVDEVITTSAFAGDYTNVNVLDNKQYTFSSSTATDYLTITNATGTVVYASGQTPVVWVSGNTSGVIRYYLHSNANCGDQETGRTRSIKCANAPVVACGIPGVPSATNITSNSARIWWTAPAAAPSNYDVYISTNSAWPEYNANPTASPMSSILVSYSPLAASTTYYYWVRSVCGSTKSDWAAGGSFTTLPALTCNSATWGLYPEDTVMLQNTGSPEAVAYQSMAGQYSNVGVVANTQYQFTSSIATDYVTITNQAGTVTLASGPTPLTWTSGNTPSTVRFYLHANANCAPDDMPRDKFAKAVTLGVNNYLAGSHFKVYPNPTVGQFSVDTGNTIADKIMIFDNVGRLISTHIPVAAKTTLTIDSLSEGVYHVKVYYQDTSSTEKLVLRKN